MDKAILIGLVTSKSTKDQTFEYLEELAFLAKTAGVNPIKRFVQNLASPDRKTFLGSGKIKEILDYTRIESVNIIIFDDELTPSQIKNLNKIFGEKTRILDRNNIILDIFASRAKTAQARTQVELAQYQYLLPAL